MKIITIMILSSLIFSALCTNGQGELRDRVNVTANERMAAHDEIEIVATELIYFGAGFKAEAGCHLRARIVTAVDVVPSPEIRNKESESRLGFFPNSVVDFVSINGSFSDAELRVFDNQGILKMTTILNGRNPSVNMSNLSSGIYLLQLGSNFGRLLKE